VSCLSNTIAGIPGSRRRPLLPLRLSLSPPAASDPPSKRPRSNTLASPFPTPPTRNRGLSPPHSTPAPLTPFLDMQPASSNSACAGMSLSYWCPWCCPFHPNDTFNEIPFLAFPFILCLGSFSHTSFSVVSHTLFNLYHLPVLLLPRFTAHCCSLPSHNRCCVPVQAHPCSSINRHNSLKALCSRHRHPLPHTPFSLTSECVKPVLHHL
jgi:hypothetical protein